MRRQRPDPRAQMLLRSVDEPATALLAKGMDETPRDGLGEHPVPRIEPLRGHIRFAANLGRGVDHSKIRILYSARQRNRLGRED